MSFNMAQLDLSRFRVPLGSIAVDATLCFTMIWWGATMQAKFEQMQHRMEAVEQQRIQPDADRRLAVLEAAAVADSRWRERMEQKMDQVIERLRK